MEPGFTPELRLGSRQVAFPPPEGHHVGAGLLQGDGPTTVLPATGRHACTLDAAAMDRGTGCGRGELSRQTDFQQRVRV